MTTASQRKKIADHLRAGGRLTPLDALRMFGCNRLAARINDLRADGMNILTNMITVTGADGVARRIAEYFLKAGTA